MSKDKHTREPWRAVMGAPGTNPNVFEIVSEDLGDHSYEVIGHVSTRKFSTLQRIDNEVIEANARRIVACVNACAGLSTSYLEKVGADGIREHYVEDLEKQRDELLAALIECLECEFSVTDKAAIDKANAAIVKAK